MCHKANLFCYFLKRWTNECLAKGCACSRTGHLEAGQSNGHPNSLMATLTQCNGNLVNL